MGRRRASNECQPIRHPLTGNHADVRGVQSVLKNTEVQRTAIAVRFEDLHGLVSANSVQGSYSHSANSQCVHAYRRTWAATPEVTA